MACSVCARAVRRAAGARLPIDSVIRHFRVFDSPHNRAAVCAPAAAAERIILGIESSCDDTGVAVVSSSGRILGEALATQEEVHRQWGGVVPSLAQEAHSQAIDRVVDEAMDAARVAYSDLDAIAYTIGPGLSLCLQVGAGKARQLAHDHNLPLVPCHHMEAHALVARLSNNVEFPFVCLLISGGHNLLLAVRGVGDYMQLHQSRWVACPVITNETGQATTNQYHGILRHQGLSVQLGTALDDSIGESFDKVARMLGLDAMPSGGPALEAFAKAGNPTAVPLKIPMQDKKTCDFSYSGLKTGVRLAMERLCPGVEEGEPDTSAASETVRADIAASFQHAAVEQLAQRVSRGLTWAEEVVPGVSTLVVSGGVAANQTVRSRLDEVAAAAGMAAVYPEVRLCTDNGVMVAWAGMERMALGLHEAPPSLEDMESGWVDVRARWPLTAEKHPRCVAQVRKRALRAPRKASRIPSEPLADMTRDALAAIQERSSSDEPRLAEV